MARLLHGGFAPFQPFLAGGGHLDPAGEALRFTIPAVGPKLYADSQIDDYHGRKRSAFPWRPPLRLEVRARMSHPAAQADSNAPEAGLRGTAGFGLWNDPFTLTGGGVLAPPSVVWFFYASPPSDMALVEGVPGWGWKAATLDSGRLPSLLVAPAALVAILLTKIPGLGRPVMAAARRAIRAHEALLSAGLTDWHDYRIDWGEREAVFQVDGAEVLRAPEPPRGPLGFVAWVDNQYAVATPQGKYGFGVIETGEPQWMELEGLSISSAVK
jgi:hypothetical protein